MDEQNAEVTEAIASLSLFDMQILAVCAAMACIAGLVRSVDDHDYRDLLHLFSLGAISGFVGLATTSGVAYFLGGVGGNELVLFFVSPVSGLSGKMIEKHLRGLLIGLIDGLFAKVFGKKNDEAGP